MRFELTRVTPIDFESIALTARPSCHHNPNHTHQQNTNTTRINTSTHKHIIITSSTHQHKQTNAHHTTTHNTPHTHTHNQRARETLPATPQTVVLTPPVSRQPQRTLKTERRPSKGECGGVEWSGVEWVWCGCGVVVWCGGALLQHRHNNTHSSSRIDPRGSHRITNDKQQTTND